MLFTINEKRFHPEIKYKSTYLILDNFQKDIINTFAKNEHRFLLKTQYLL